MLILSVLLLGIAALAGIALFALYQWVKPTGRVWLPGAIHGATGLAGFAFLLLALRGPARGVAMGAGSFGSFAAVLLALGLVLGGLAAVARWRRRQPAALILGLHATLAVAGLVMLVAYASAGP